MMICYYKEEKNPEEINELIKRVNGFSNGDLYKWGSISKVYKDIVEKKTVTNYRLSDNNLAEIRDALKAGKPVMIWLDYNPKTVKNDMHWVLAVDYDDNDENNIKIADPIDGKIKSIKSYLGWVIKDVRRTIEGYVVYDTIEDKVVDCEKYKLAIDEIKKIINKYQL